MRNHGLKNITILLPVPFGSATIEVVVVSVILSVVQNSSDSEWLGVMKNVFVRLCIFIVFAVITFNAVFFLTVEGPLIALW